MRRPAHSIERGDQLQSNRVWLNALAVCRRKSFLAGSFPLSLLSALITVCLFAPQCLYAQRTAASAAIESTPSTAPIAPPDASPSAAPAPAPDTFDPASASTSSDSITAALVLADPVPTQQPRKRNWFNLPGESELIFEGLVSYGNYKIFASGYDEKLFTGGIEYDRHSWGTFLKAQVDYVGEFLPFVLLDKPLHTDIWGNPRPRADKNIRQHVPGIGISPIGFRLQWRSNKTIKPYLEAKGGVLVFADKVPSTSATYENFSLQSAGGVQVKMNDRWGLRLGLFSDFHFSDAFIVPVNPGLDVMNANLGLSYHF